MRVATETTSLKQGPYTAIVHNIYGNTVHCERINDTEDWDIYILPIALVYKNA